MKLTRLASFCLIFTLITACGAKDNDASYERFLSNGDVNLFITNSFAGKGIGENESNEINASESTIRISAGSDNLADLFIHYNFIKHSGISDNETCDITLNGVPFSEKHGSAVFDATLPDGKMSLGIIPDEILFSDVAIKGNVEYKDESPSISLTITGRIKDRPLAISITGVTFDKEMSGFNPDLPITVVDPKTIFEFLFYNDSTQEIGVTDARGLISLSIPSKESASIMVDEVVFDEGNRLQVKYPSGNTKEYGFDEMARTLTGLECERERDFYLSTSDYKIEPFFYERQRYHLQ